MLESLNLQIRRVGLVWVKANLNLFSTCIYLCSWDISHYL